MAGRAGTRELIILGTGIHALEMAEIVERINRAEPAWELLGYLASDPATVGQTLNGVEVLGTEEALSGSPDAFLVTDNTWPNRERLSRDRLVSIVDPSCFVSRTATIGAGCVIYPGSFVGANARLGDFVFCLAGSIINHDDELGNGVCVTSGVSLAGYVRVGAGCYLGQSCTVRQYLTIGEGSLIGMGAVVVRDVPPNSVMAGNPARRLRDNTPRDGKP